MLCFQNCCTHKWSRRKCEHQHLQYKHSLSSALQWSCFLRWSYWVFAGVQTNTHCLISRDHGSTQPSDSPAIDRLDADSEHASVYDLIWPMMPEGRETSDRINRGTTIRCWYSAQSDVTRSLYPVPRGWSMRLTAWHQLGTARAEICRKYSLRAILGSRKCLLPNEKVGDYRETLNDKMTVIKTSTK